MGTEYMKYKNATENINSTEVCLADETGKKNGFHFTDGICKICVPVFGRSTEELLVSAEEALRSPADMFEWRCDYADREDIDTDAYIAQLQKQWEQLSAMLDARPVLVTHRSKREGGEGRSDAFSYGKIVQWASGIGADFLDVELSSLRECSRFSQEREKKEAVSEYEIVKELQSRVSVIMSAHYFHCTPEEDEMFTILKGMEMFGADVAKLAVMPGNKADVIRLLSVGARASDCLRCPVVTMSMGKIGAISRIASGLSGSVMTFASAREASAPGQLTAEAAARIREWL